MTQAADKCAVVDRCRNIWVADYDCVGLELRTLVWQSPTGDVERYRGDYSGGTAKARLTNWKSGMHAYSKVVRTWMTDIDSTVKRVKTSQAPSGRTMKPS